jgi:hypothetical protein
LVLAITFSAGLELSLSIIIGILYGAVAMTVGARKVSKESRIANGSFSVWWWGLAALTLFGELWTIVQWFVPTTLPLWIAYISFVLLIIMIAFTGLLYYFLYLWSGREWIGVPIALFYLGMFVFLIYYVMLQEPTGIDAEGTVIFANDLSASSMGTAIGVLWLLPTIIGASLYLSLLSKVKSREARFRVIMVASSILFWFLILLSSDISGLNEASWWTIGSQIISMIVAVVVLLAFKPPAAIRRWIQPDGPPRLPPEIDLPRE